MEYIDKETIRILMKTTANMTNDELRALRLVLQEIALEELIVDGLIDPIKRDGEIIDTVLTKKGIIEYCKFNLLSKIGKSYFEKTPVEEKELDIDLPEELGKSL